MYKLFYSLNFLLIMTVTILGLWSTTVGLIESSTYHLILGGLSVFVLLPMSVARTYILVNYFNPSNKG